MLLQSLTSLARRRKLFPVAHQNALAAGRLVRDTSSARHVSLIFKSLSDRTADDIVNLLGPIPSQAETLLLSLGNADNLLILEPDTLITATAISTAMPCPRKPLLQERLRSTNRISEAMLYGNLLHELFQLCLEQNEWDDAFRLLQARKLCKREANLAGIWQIDKQLDEVLEAISEKSKGWQAWAKVYVADQPHPQAVLSDPRGTTDDSNQVCLSAVHDIEEDIWSPKYGLKGKMDASLSTRVYGTSATPNEKRRHGVVTPFEIKTGKSTFSVMHHRAQTMLYTLLMSDRYSWHSLQAFNIVLTDSQMKTSQLAYCITLKLTKSIELHRPRTRSALCFSLAMHWQRIQVYVFPRILERVHRATSKILYHSHRRRIVRLRLSERYCPSPSIAPKSVKDASQLTHACCIERCVHPSSMFKG